MGAWGEKFFDNDDAADLASMLSSHYIKKNETRQIILKWLESCPKKLFDPVDLSFLRRLNDKLNTPEYQEPKKIKKLFSTINDNEPSFEDISYVISSNLIEGENTSSYNFTQEDIQALYEATIEAIFHEKDMSYFLAETLTSFGIISNSQELLNNPTLDIIYKRSKTEEPQLSFYAVALMFSQLQPSGAHHTITPYVFKQFLNATSIYLSTEELSDWGDTESRFKEISKELDLVVGAIAKTPAHIKVLGEHYDYIVATNERVKKEDQYFISDFQTAKSPIKRFLPPEPKAYEQPKTQAILEKYLLSEKIGSTTDKVSVNNTNKFKI